MLPKLSLIPILLCALLPPAFAAPDAISLNTGWRFHLGDLPGAETPAFDDSAWRTVDVPHDWAIEQGYFAQPSMPANGQLPGGIGWYRKSFLFQPGWAGKQVLVRFDGTYMNSTVYLNGTKVGGRPYGYISYVLDLTPYVRPGANVFAVRLDDSLLPSARWYTGAGIYGDVTLLVKAPLHIPPFGICVRTDGARVTVSTGIVNGSESPGELNTTILDPDGQVVAQATAPIASGSNSIVDQSIPVPHPRLWDLDHPYLYSVRSELHQAGRTVDSEQTTFGFRTLRWDPDQGFFLNGRPVKLKGVCEHADGGPVGAAMPLALLQRRLQMLKDMGVNAIRTAHNPRVPEFYDLCDRMGILVMDEIFDGWGKKAGEDYGARFFQNWWQTDAADCVRRDRNHPCIILWSIGNETGASDKFGIASFIHQLDPTRATTGGAVIHGVDVSGFNGGIIPKTDTLAIFHAKNPRQPIVLTEEPHTFQTRGFYQAVSSIFSPSYPVPPYATTEVFPPGPEAYRSSYDNCGRRVVVRDCWRRTLETPWIAGEFRWTGFDYLGEAEWAGTQQPARAFDFGVIDLAGFPKDDYYLYQSLWTDKPMVHLLPDWTLPGLEGRTVPVVAYGNADAVELFQDGKSLGRETRSPWFDFVWQVPYRPGVLKAVAYRAGQAVAETSEQTAGAPAALHLSADNSALKPDRRDLSLVTFKVCDARGTVVPGSDDRIDIALSGPARLLGYENGDPVDLTPNLQPWRRAFAGLARGFYSGLDGQEAPINIVALAVLRDWSVPARISIAAGQLSLRGPLPSGDLSIHFTTGGSPATVSSLTYTKPLDFTVATTVNACAVRDGRIVATTSTTVTPGPRPVFHAVSPGGEQSSAEDPNQTKW